MTTELEIRTGLDALPATADKTSWTPEQAALMTSLGLKGVKRRQINGTWTEVPFEAPSSIVQAFLHQARTRRLDPLGRQIYCIERGGKWGIEASIDGFRLQAERSGEYLGQTEPEWTDGSRVKVPLREDGKIVRDAAGNVIMTEDFLWVPVWISDSPPAAARIGIKRAGFPEPMWAVATYAGYCPRDRDGNLKPTGQWHVNPANQLLKCFDTETEILTNRGFMRFAEVGDERIMQVTEHGLEAVDAVPFAQQYSGPMIANHGDMLDFTVTPNHDMVTTVGKVEAGAMLATSNYRSSWRIPLTVSGQRPDNALVKDGDLRLAAAIVADGNATGADAFRVAVSRPAKVAALREMRPESERVEHSAGRSVVTKSRTIRTNFDKDVFRFSADRVRAFIDMGKTITLDAMLALSPRQMRVFVDAWVEFDGSVNQKSGVRRLYTSRPDHLRAAELLAVGAGYSVNVARERTSDISTRPNFVLTISEPNAQPVNLPLGDRPGIAQEPSNESGVVWCVTVPSGQIIVRRRGFSMIVGNCTEMLGLRKAFPSELSGLYGAEEMDQAGSPRGDAPVSSAPRGSSTPIEAPVAAPPESDRDWKAEIDSAVDMEALRAVHGDAQQGGFFSVLIDTSVEGVQQTVEQALWARRGELEKADPLPGTEPGKPKQRAWLDEAKGLKYSEEVSELWREATALGAHKRTVDALAELAGRLPTRPVEPAPDAAWAPVTDDTDAPSPEGSPAVSEESDENAATT